MPRFLADGVGVTFCANDRVGIHFEKNSRCTLDTCYHFRNGFIRICDQQNMGLDTLFVLIANIDKIAGIHVIISEMVLLESKHGSRHLICYR